MKVQVFINPTKISITDRAFNYGDGLFETILVTINDKLVEFKDESELRTYLAHCGAFSINEANTMNMLAVAFNHVSDFVELDFVQSIKSPIHEGVEVNVVTLGDNVFINRITQQWM